MPLALEHVRGAQQLARLERLDARPHGPRALQRDRLARGQRHRRIGQHRLGDLASRGVLRGPVRLEHAPLVRDVLADLAVDGQSRRAHGGRPRLVLHVELTGLAGDDDVRAARSRSERDRLAVGGDPVERADGAERDRVLAVGPRADGRERLRVLRVVVHGTAFRLYGLRPCWSRHRTMPDSGQPTTTVGVPYLRVLDPARLGERARVVLVERLCDERVADAFREHIGVRTLHGVAGAAIVAGVDNHHAELPVAEIADRGTSTCLHVRLQCQRGLRPRVGRLLQSLVSSNMLPTATHFGELS